MFVAQELNPATYILGSKLSTDQRRRYLGYTTITQTAVVGNDEYNALQATLEQRVSHGVSLMANYTWAHSLNDLPLESEITDQATGELGHGNSFLKAAVNGWQTTGIFQIQSGQPLTITAGQDISLTNIGQDRAQYNGTLAYGAGPCTTNTNCHNYLNPKVFTLPATGQFGNVVKGSSRGPGLFDWDAGLIRNFAIKESVRLEFRAEYFDLLNHTNFNNPVTSVSAAAFGGITSSNDPRIAQLSMKLAF